MIFREWIKGMAEVYPDLYGCWTRMLISFVDDYKVDNSIYNSNIKNYSEQICVPLNTFPLLYSGMAFTRDRIISTMYGNNKSYYVDLDSSCFYRDEINDLFRRAVTVLEASGKVFDGKTLPDCIKEAYNDNIHKEKTLKFLDQMRSVLRFIYALNSEIVGNNIKPIFGDGKAISIPNWLSLMQSFIPTEDKHPDIGSIIEKTNLYLANKIHKIVLYPARMTSQGYADSLHKSCQNNNGGSGYDSINSTTVYYDCFNNIRLMALLNEKNQVQARCIIWKVGKENEYVVDRVYDYNDMSGFFDTVKSLINKEMEIDLVGGGKETIKIIDVRDGKLSTSSNAEFKGWIVGGKKKIYYSHQIFDNEIKSADGLQDRIVNPPESMQWFDSCKMIRIRANLDNRICFMLGGDNDTINKFRSSKNKTIKSQFFYIGGQPNSYMYHYYSLRVGHDRKWSKKGLFEINKGMYDSIENIRLLVDKDGDVRIITTYSLSEKGKITYNCGMNKKIYDNLKELKLVDAMGNDFDIEKYVIDSHMNILVIDKDNCSPSQVSSKNMRNYIMQSEASGFYYIPKNMTCVKLAKEFKETTRFVLVSGKHLVRTECVDITEMDLNDDGISYVKLEPSLYNVRGTSIYVEEDSTVKDNSGRYILFNDSANIDGITFLQNYNLEGLLQWSTQ